MARPVGMRRPTRRAGFLQALVGWLGMAVVVPVILLIYLQVYPRWGWLVPAGADATTYIWRTNVVIAEGLPSLAGSSPYPFDANGSNPDRPATPLLGALIDGTLGVRPWDLAVALPAVGAVIVAVTFVGVALVGMKEPRWTAPIYALVGGLSGSVQLVANGYFDTLLVLGLLLVVATSVLLAADDRRAILPGALMLSTAFAVHWLFASLFTAIVLCFSATLAVWSLARARTDRRDLGPAVRTGSIALLGGASGLALTLLRPGSAWPAGRGRSGYAEKLTIWLRRLRLPWFAAPCAIGAGALVVPSDVSRRRALLFWAVWTLPSLLAYLAFQVGFVLPAHRIVGYAIPVWLLLGAGVVWLARSGWVSSGRLGPVARRAARALVVSSVLVVSIAYAWRAGVDWIEGSVPAYHDGAVVSALKAASGYLQGLPEGTPVIVPVLFGGAEEMFGVVPALRRLRAAVPPRLADDLFVYLGSPDELLAGVPTLRGDPVFDAVSQRYWDALVPILRRGDPVILGVAPYTPGVHEMERTDPRAVLTRGVVVLRGPQPLDRAPRVVLPRPDLLALVGRAGLILLLLLAVGSGWSLLLFRVGIMEAVALAPATGVAMLVAGGEPIAWLVGRLAHPWLVVAPIGAIGWTLFVLLRLRPRARPQSD
jgi:hypothetical protein